MARLVFCLKRKNFLAFTRIKNKNYIAIIVAAIVVVVVDWHGI